MKPDTQSHLSQEALDDVLIGISSRVSRAHLAQCEECRARVAEFQSAIHDFNAASLRYSEAQPVRTFVTAKPAPRFASQPAFAAWAVAAILLVGAPSAWHFFRSHPSQAPATAMETAETENQIAADNSLLQQVNSAIAPDEESVVDQYHLLENSGTQAELNTRTE